MPVATGSRRPGHDRFFHEVARGFANGGRLMFLSLEAGPAELAQNTALVAVTRAGQLLRRRRHARRKG
jgi:hypothetical protein